MEWTQEQRAAFADLIRSARARTGLKQYEVAERLDINAGTLSQLERGPYEGMRWWDVARLAHFYGLPMDHLTTALGLPSTSAAKEAADVFVVGAELAGLNPVEREEVRTLVRLLVKGLRSKE